MKELRRTFQDSTSTITIEEAIGTDYFAIIFDDSSRMASIEAYSLGNLESRTLLNYEHFDGKEITKRRIYNGSGNYVGMVVSYEEDGEEITEYSANQDHLTDVVKNIFLYLIKNGKSVE